jgi:hypothetical protein
VSTSWSDSAKPSTSYGDDSPAPSKWKELRTEVAWETEQLDVTKTEDWTDVNTEDMGPGTARTVWTPDD